MKDILDNIMTIKPRVLAQKSVNIGDKIIQILQIDSYSMMKISYESNLATDNATKMNVLLLKYCTKGLDHESFMINNNFGEVSKLVMQICEFNDLI